MTVCSEVTRSISEQGEIFRIDVANRVYHYLSQSEIAGGKRISRHLSGRGSVERKFRVLIAAWRIRLVSDKHGDVGVGIVPERQKNPDMQPGPSRCRASEAEIPLALYFV